MPELWTSSGGVNRKLKELYTPSGGVNRKLKDLYAASGGVNRKIFSGIDAIVTAIEVNLGSTDDQYTVTIGEDGSLYLYLHRSFSGNAIRYYSVNITYQTAETLSWQNSGEVIGVNSLHSMPTYESSAGSICGVSPHTNEVKLEYSVADYSLRAPAGSGCVFTLKIGAGLRYSDGRYSMSWPAGALRLAGKTIANVENKATIQVVIRVPDYD